jgi:valyl-tRNA synthetase
MRQPYPEPDTARIDEAAETDMAWVMAFILGVRRIRGEMDIAPGRALPVLLQDASDADRRRLDAYLPYLSKLARLADLAFLPSGAPAPEAALALVDGMGILVPLAGLIDTAEEQQRLEREIARLGQERDKLKARLDNSAFVERAPAEVVGKEQARLERLGADLLRLESQKARLARLS